MSGGVGVKRVGVRGGGGGWSGVEEVQVGVGKDGVGFGGVQIRGWGRDGQRSRGLGSKRLELGWEEFGSSRDQGGRRVWGWGEGLGSGTWGMGSGEVGGLGVGGVGVRVVGIRGVGVGRTWGRMKSRDQGG